MMNRTTTLAILILTSASPAFAQIVTRRASATSELTATSADVTVGRASFDGCAGGACRPEDSAAIDQAASGALKSGGLSVADPGERASMTAQVPAPALGDDKEGSKDEPGFFGKLWGTVKDHFSGKGLLYGAGGAAVGAGVGFLVGGPVGAVIGGLLGLIGGPFFK